MINLQFLNISIEGFQSIGKADINFHNLGTCYIKGINRYDTKTASNGSGKSSLLSSIHWCLFGKTPAGIGNDVINKFSNTGCNVELNMIIDGVNYIIRRSQNHQKYKTNLVILKESEDISGRNKSDSEKVIKEIININDEVFSQMIFLSQGFANRFAIYAPKARRELLESLYNIDEKLNVFIEDLKVKESIINQNIRNNSSVRFEAHTKLSMLEANINTNNDIINDTQDQIHRLSDYKSNVTQEEIVDIQNKISESNLQIDTVQNKLNDKILEKNIVSNRIKELQNNKRNAEFKIKDFSNNKICPTCGTVLEDYSNNEHIQKHLIELKESINMINIELNSLFTDETKFDEIISKINSKLQLLKNNRNVLTNELNNKNIEYQQELQRTTQITALSDKISDYQTKNNQMSNEIQELNKTLILCNEKEEKLNIDSEVMSHSIRLANNQFKSYLLENIIHALNDKLKELSISLFENEVIQINGDSKLDILVGNKTYEQCSGGEQRKCDVALIIAQRYLAQQMNSISSNILILDEVFDGLDDVSFSIVLDLLADEIQDVESTFIISHRDIKEIPFDNVITVIKNQNQISEIELS